MAEKVYQNEEWLKYYYVNAGESPEEIADRAGVTVQTVYKYLNKFKLIK